MAVEQTEVSLSKAASVDGLIDPSHGHWPLHVLLSEPIRPGFVTEAATSSHSKSRAATSEVACSAIHRSRVPRLRLSPPYLLLESLATRSSFPQTLRPTRGLGQRRSWVKGIPSRNT